MMVMMRSRLLSAVLAVCAPGAAYADQTDSRLDRLFEQLRTGDAGDADAIVESIQAIWADSQSDTVDALYQRAVSAVNAEQFDLAGALLDHVTGLAPSFAQGYALRGVVRLGADDQTGAITDFSRAIELEPRQFEARIALAEVMLAGGDKRGAYAMLQKAIEWNPHEDYARERARKLRDQLDGQEI